MFTQDDDTRAGIEELARRVRGARRARAARRRRRARRDDRFPASRHTRSSSRCCMIQSFYRAGERRWRLARGLDPDSAAAPQQGDRDGLMLLAFRNGRILTDAGIEARPDAAGARRPYRGDGRRARGASAPIASSISTAELLVPGFIDTQVNGGGGVLFNDDPSVETIARHRRARTGVSAPRVFCPR